MAITVEAVYENGVFRPLRPGYLREQQQVRITVEEPVDWVCRTCGIVPCSDEALIEWAAMDVDLEYDFGDGQRFDDSCQSDYDHDRFESADRLTQQRCFGCHDHAGPRPDQAGQQRSGL